MEKKELRREMKRQTLALTESEVKRQSEAAMKILLQQVEFRRPSMVALFAPLADEIQLLPLVEKLSCRVVLPRVEGDDMEFYDYDSRAMQIGSFGIVEPQGVEPVEAEQIDLMVVPGVAFTAAGDRLGRGKGYYDRYLSREGFRAFCVGVCYEHQVVESLPVEPHDKAMDEVVSSNSK